MIYIDREVANARANHPFYRTWRELEEYVDAFCRGDDQEADRVDREARERIAKRFGDGASPENHAGVTQASERGTT